VRGIVLSAPFFAEKTGGVDTSIIWPFTLHFDDAASEERLSGIASKR